jgi:hypothetical protein
MLRYRVAFAHNAFVLNEHLSTAGVIDKTKVKDTIVLDERPIMDPSFRDLREPLHLAQGGVMGRTHKGLLTLGLRGRIIVPDTTQQAKLGDRERALRAAFDPYGCYFDSPATDGVYALDFSDVTADTATYGTGGPGGAGIIPLRYYVRPQALARVGETLRDGASRPFSLGLIAPDPRMYEQAEQTLVLTPGAPTGNVINRGTTAGPLKLTVVMTGAGSAGFQVQLAAALGTINFRLDLSGLVNTDTVVVIFETCGPYGLGKTVKLNGADAFTRKVTDAASWLYAPVGTTSVTISSATNVSTATLAWYSARA